MTCNDGANRSRFLLATWIGCHLSTAAVAAASSASVAAAALPAAVAVLVVVLLLPAGGAGGCGVELGGATVVNEVVSCHETVNITKKSVLKYMASTEYTTDNLIETNKISVKTS